MIAGAVVLTVVGTAAAKGGGGCLDDSRAAELVREATRWRQELARTRRDAPRYKDLGELNARIESLEEELAALGCPVVWNGARYRVRRGGTP